MKATLINGNVLNFREYLNMVFVMQFRASKFPSAP